MDHLNEGFGLWFCHSTECGKAFAGKSYLATMKFFRFLMLTEKCQYQDNTGISYGLIFSLVSVAPDRYKFDLSELKQKQPCMLLGWYIK